MSTTKKKITCASLARELGISEALFSKVLRNTSKTTLVAAKTKQRILKAVWDSGIELNRNIGILLPREVYSAETLYYPMFAGLATRCAENGYGLFSAIQEDGIPDFLEKRNICGLVFWNEVPQNLLEYAEEEFLPYLALNPQHDFSGDAVVFNDYEHMYELLEYLQSKGYRNYIISHMFDNSEHGRILMAALHAFLQKEQLNGIIYRDFSELSQLVRESGEDTVFLQFSRLDTVKVLEYFTLWGKRIPEDGGVVGHGTIGEYYQTPLTSLKYPYFESGKAATDLLLRKLNERKYQLHVRETVQGIIIKYSSTKGK